jgi:hypothetical protein
MWEVEDEGMVVGRVRQVGRVGKRIRGKQGTT